MSGWRAFFAATLLLMSDTVFADYKSDFAEGVVAAERQNWANVRSTMQRALAEQPTPSASTRIQGVAYLPKFYLGLAAWNEKDCVAAIRYLEDPATVAAMRGLKEASRQALMLRTCRARLAAQEAPKDPVSSPAAVATTDPGRATPTTTPATKPPAVTPPQPTPATVASKPADTGLDQRRVKALRDRLVVIDALMKDSSIALNDAAGSSGGAELRTRFDTLRLELRRQRDGISVVARGRDVAALTRAETDLGRLNQQATALKSELQAAQLGVRNAALAANAARAAEERQARAQLASLIRPTLNAYFSGEYVKVAGWTPDPRFDRLPDAKAQALVLRAAARHAQFVMAGARDAALEEQSRADIREARRLFAQIQPSPRAYSPRFRRFFASTL